MSHSLRKILLTTAAISLTALPALAHAQSSVDALTDEIVIVSTKKKNAENVQDVPLAVSAYGDAQLEALKVRNLESLAYSMPNVSLDQIGTAKGIANFQIRGLGINSSIPSVDPTVGVFVDGVYLGVNNGVVLDNFDLDSIEVLRGPQGILFGRNVTGGAVVINTKNPSSEFGGEVKVAVETGLNKYVQGYVTGPLGDRIAGKLAVYYNEDDGWFKNYLGGPTLGQPDRFEEFGASKSIIVRPSLRFDLSDNATLVAKYEHGEVDAQGPAAQNTGGLIVDYPRDSFLFSINEEGDFAADWDQVTLRTDIDVAFGDGRITNITGWRQFENTTVSDIDSTPLELFTAPTHLKQEQLSNELRYAGTLGQTDISAGIYYFQQDFGYTEIRNLLGGALNFYGGGKQDQKTYGVFAQADFPIQENTKLIVGGRFTKEEKDARIATLVLPKPACSVVENTCPYDFVQSNSWNNFSPKLAIEHTDSNGDLWYASYTKGFRAGGYNFRNTSLEPDPNDPTQLRYPPNFDEETVNAFEVGLKHTLDDNRGYLNFAVFSNQVSDMQLEGNFPDALTGVAQVIVNAGEASIFGIEAETRYRVTDSFILTGSIGWIEAKYDSLDVDLNADGNIDDIDLGLDLTRVAPLTYSIGALYERDTTFGLLTSRIGLNHRDGSAYTFNNNGQLPEADMVDGSITLLTRNDSVSISLYGKNLLDEVTIGGDTQLPPALGPAPLGGTFSPLNKGRVVGLEAKYSF